MEIDEAETLYKSLANDYLYREETLAGYVSGVYTTDEFRITGGVRVDRSEFDAEMASVENGVVLPGKAYASGAETEVLPYLNATWLVSPDFRIKASASKTLGRPNPEMIATIESYNYEEFTASRGNPQIKPRQATNLDLGMEYYFNGEDTTYKGLELGLINSSFVDLHPALAPLGASLNVMWVDGESSYIYNDVLQEIDQLQYQSKYAGNAAVFWTFAPGTEVRLAANFQGEYMNEFAANPWQNLWIEPFTTFDLTAKWRIDQNLQLRLRGRNIFSKERGRTIGPNNDLFRANLEIGSTWFVDLNYRF